MLFANLPGMWSVNGSQIYQSSHRIAGGAPAGIKTRPGEEGCRTTITSIRIITISGNNKTNPNGIETFEFPFSRMRLLKKPSWGKPRSFLGAHSSKEAREGRLGDDGILFAIFCTNPMLMAGPGATHFGT